MVSVLFLLWIFLPLHTVEGKESCRECHFGAGAQRLGLGDVYAGIERAGFQHDNVPEKCDVCHIVGAMGLGRTWELDSYSSYTGLIFFLKGLSLDRTYYIELKTEDGRGRDSSFSATFRPYKVARTGNDRKAPLIRNARVSEIKEGVFLEATLKWETDEPAISMVEYGEKGDYGQSVRSEALFTTDHAVRVSGFKRGRIYHYRITVSDVFGNLSASQDSAIDTPARVEEPASAGRGGSSAPTVKFFRIDSTADTCIEVSATSAVRVRLRVVESMETGKHGPGLTPARDLRINACMRCHSRIVQMMVSHPVGMPGMRMDVQVPPEFPTIEGRVMTCVTCHYPHGGDEVYFARFPLEGDPCAVCHKGGAGIP